MTRQKIHSAHLAVNACLSRARKSVFWLGMIIELQNQIAQCEICCSLKIKLQKESISQYALPCVVVDLFHHYEKEYMVTTDYCSYFIEVDHL